MSEDKDILHRALQILDRRIGFLLRVGIIISLALIIAGMIIFAVKGEPATTTLTQISQIVVNLIKWDGAAYITTGLLIILLLPAAIILTSLAHFIGMRERNPIIACVILLAMLAVSFIFIVK